MGRADRKTVSIDTRPTETRPHLAFDGHSRRYREDSCCAAGASGHTPENPGLARSCTKRTSGAIAMTPTNHPEKSLLAIYMREREAVRARAPVISEKIVGLEAQLASKRRSASRA